MGVHYPNSWVVDFMGNPMKVDNLMGGTLIAGWFLLGKILKEHGWWLGVPLFQESSMLECSILNQWIGLSGNVTGKPNHSDSLTYCLAVHVAYMHVYMGVSINGATPIAGWFCWGKSKKKWMITGVPLFQESSMLEFSINHSVNGLVSGKKIRENPMILTGNLWCS